MAARYETIAIWADKYRWTKGAELGVSDGTTHRYLLAHCPQLTLLVGVDIWDLPVPQGRTFSNETCNCLYCERTRWDRRATTVQQREKSAHLALATGRSLLWKMASTDAAKYVDDHSLDFVFIDGDHSQEGVSADIMAWTQKVRPGGRVIGHDYNMKSVRDAVHEHFDWIHTGDDHLWFIDIPS